MATTFTLAAEDHTGHDVSPDFEALCAEQVRVATPFIEALAAAGWRDIEFDHELDCEVPEAHDTVNVTATVDAGAVGPLRVRARIVPARAATASDRNQLLGAALPTGAVVVLLVADRVEDTVLEHGNFKVRTLAQLGLTH